MTSTLAVDASPAPSFPPLLPGDDYMLRHGYSIYPGADLGRLNRRGVDHDGVPLGWTGAYKFQSDRDLVFRLTRAAFAQGVWSPAEIFTNLTAQTGGSWLLAQEQPDIAFEGVVADIEHVGAPRHSVENIVRLVLQMADDLEPVRRRDLIAALTCEVEGRDKPVTPNNGDFNWILDLMAAEGFTSETKKIGPKGKTISRWIYRTTKGSVDSIIAMIVRAASARMAKIKSSRNRVAQTTPVGTRGRASARTHERTHEHPEMAKTGPAGQESAELGSERISEPLDLWQFLPKTDSSPKIATTETPTMASMPPRAAQASTGEHRRGLRGLHRARCLLAGLRARVQRARRQPAPPKLTLRGLTDCGINHDLSPTWTTKAGCRAQESTSHRQPHVGPT